jgi:CHAT domain-containing protein/tetratricopeptide (TPR) repeat protein
MRYWQCAPTLLALVMLLVGGGDHLACAESMSEADLRFTAYSFTRNGQYGKALPFAQRYAEAVKARAGEGDEYADALRKVAKLLEARNRIAEAEALFRRIVTLSEKQPGLFRARAELSAFNDLGQLLYNAGRFDEAEPPLRRAYELRQRFFWDDPDRSPLNNLAQLLQATDRDAEAAVIYDSLLAIERPWMDAETKGTSGSPKARRSHRNVIQILKQANRLNEAEPVLRSALALTVDVPTMPWETAGYYDDLITILQDTGRSTEAEPMARWLVSYREDHYGPEHREVGAALNRLAMLRADLGDWAEAAALHRRAKPIMIAARSREVGIDRTGVVNAIAASNTWNLRAGARAVFRAGANDSAARDEGFEIAQWALQTGAGDALFQMSVRFARGTQPLAQLVRSRQDLVSLRREAVERRDATDRAGDQKAAEETRTIADLDAKLGAIDNKLAAAFPGYASLTNPKPLTIAAVQALLKPDEAAIVYLDVPRFGKLPEETLAWGITKGEIRWISIPLGTSVLGDRVAALRCGLDATNWGDATGWPDKTLLDKQRIREQQARRVRCKELLGVEASPREPPPFDLGRAHDLYMALLAPFNDLTEGKHLIIVPSGPLTSLPFHVLVTQTPTGDTPRAERYRNAAWLALTQSITVLPSVGSLQALRKLAPSKAKEPYIGFGNPLLDGGPADGERSTRARAAQICPRELNAPVHNADISRQHLAVLSARGPLGLGSPMRGSGRAIDLAVLRAQPPLPETAAELCDVARTMGAMDRQMEAVWLGARASETNLKTLSRSSRLAQFRVLHFATHGLLSGESEAILKAKPEPALLLTPPAEGVSAADLENDDGLLTASEVAQLDLDADWVVLSACNTAAGAKGDAEVLSGLARAFFYAKARALLVSHWYVSSDAAVKLTTQAFAALKADPSIGRAEALRRSMVRLVNNGQLADAHPSNWAPFVLVGEGGK